MCISNANFFFITSHFVSLCNAHTVLSFTLFSGFDASADIFSFHFKLEVYLLLLHMTLFIVVLTFVVYLLLQDAVRCPISNETYSRIVIVHLDVDYRLIDGECDVLAKVYYSWCYATRNNTVEFWRMVYTTLVDLWLGCIIHAYTDLECSYASLWDKNQETRVCSERGGHGINYEARMSTCTKASCQP